jgi:hypothetical protein
MADIENGSVTFAPWPPVTVAQLRIRDLRAALICHELVEDALLALGELRRAGARKYQPCVALTARILRVFDVDEIDYFASVIRDRMALGVWGSILPGGCDADALPLPASGVPGSRSVKLAAERLAQELDAARCGLAHGARLDIDVAIEQGCTPEIVRQAVSRLSRVAGVSTAGGTSARTNRRRRKASSLRVEAERTHLEAEVMAGRLRRLSQGDLDAGAIALGLPPGSLGTLDDSVAIFTS